MKKSKFANKRLKILKKFRKINFNNSIYFLKDSNEIITVKNIAKEIGLDKRQTIRLINLYKKCLEIKDFSDFLEHKNSEKCPWNKFDSSVTQPYVDKYIKIEKELSEIDERCIYYPNQYIYDLSESDSLKISESTIRKALRNNNILSPLAKKKTKKLYKKNKQNISDDYRKKQNEKALKYIAKKMTSKWYTPFGEKIEGDAWFFDVLGLGYNVATGALIDNSGYLLCSDCELQETNELYYSLFYQLFNNYGVPKTFVIDCRMTFYSPPGREKTDFTQSLENLGVEVICSPNPKAKPNVERLWYTLQNWIVPTLIIRGIDTFAKYKYFCQNELPDLYNKRFGKAPFKYNNKNSFRKIDSNDLGGVFEKTYTKTVTKKGTIRMENKIYKAVDENNNKVNLYSDQVVVHKRMIDGLMYVQSGTSKYYLIEDELPISNIEEIQAQKIKRLQQEIINKNKKISYLECRLKKLESIVESKS